MIKVNLVALDVDGTLITDDYEITSLTKQAVKQVYDQGGQIVLCTGRGPVSTLPLLEELGLTGMVITHNGAATIDSATKAVLHENSFAMSDVEQFINHCRAEGIHYDVNTAFDLYVDRLPEEVREMYDKYMAKPIEVGDVMNLQLPIVKISASGEGAVLDRLISEWQRIGNPALRIIRSGDHFIDVMHRDANKGNALKSLAHDLNIEAEHVLAIGNYNNDIEMIEFAGWGVAMDNSPDDVKRRANAVTASNNEEGVYLALLKYAIIEKE